MKSIYKKTCSEQTLWQKTKSLSLNIKNKARITGLTTFIQHGPGNFNQYSKEGREKAHISERKK